MQRRPDRTERKRGRIGQRIRKRRLARSKGLCEDCLDKGMTRVAVEVHHIVALAHGGSDEDENTRNLCEPCHDERTAEQFGFASIGKGVDSSGRPTFSNHPWNLNREGGGSKVEAPSGVHRPPTLHVHCGRFQSKKLRRLDGPEKGR